MSAKAPRRRPDEGPQRPSRPATVELAAAIMIVTGLVSALTSVQFAMQQANEGTDLGLLAYLSVAIGVGSAVLGLLVRYGAAWLVAVNAMAVVAFLELISGTPVGLLFGGVDVLVVLILLFQRPWFAWTPDLAPTPDADDR